MQRDGGRENADYSSSELLLLTSLRLILSMPGRDSRAMLVQASPSFLLCAGAALGNIWGEPAG